MVPRKLQVSETFHSISKSHNGICDESRSLVFVNFLESRIFKLFAVKFRIFKHARSRRLGESRIFKDIPSWYKCNKQRDRFLDIFYILVWNYCNPYLGRGNIRISFNLIENRNSQQPLEQNFSSEHVCFSTLLSKGVLLKKSLAFS